MGSGQILWRCGDRQRHCLCIAIALVALVRPAWTFAPALGHHMLRLACARPTRAPPSPRCGSQRRGRLMSMQDVESTVFHAKLDDKRVKKLFAWLNRAFGTCAYVRASLAPSLWFCAHRDTPAARSAQSVFCVSPASIYFSVINLFLYTHCAVGAYQPAIGGTTICCTPLPLFLARRPRVQRWEARSGKMFYLSFHKTCSPSWSMMPLRSSHPRMWS